MTLFLLALHIALTQNSSIQFSVSGRPLLASWAPKGKRLYIISADEDKANPCLYEWPSGKRIKLPFLPEWKLQMKFDESGSKAVIFGASNKKVLTAEFPLKKIEEVEGDCYSAWWIGKDLARIRPLLPNNDWSAGQFLQVGNRKAALPKNRKLDYWGGDKNIIVGSGSVLFPGGAIEFRQIDLRTLSTKLIRRHEKPHVSLELDEQNSISWNTTLEAAILTLTADTGGQTSSPFLSIRSGKIELLEPKSAGLFFLSKTTPKWIGSRIVFVGTTQTPGNEGNSYFLKEVHSLMAYKMGQSAFTSLRSIQGFDGKKSNGFIDCADVSPDGKWLAIYDSTTGGKVKIQPISLPGT